MANQTAKEGNISTPYFDAKYLPKPEYAYVAWVDVMGVRTFMARSLATTANFIFKLHSAILESPQTSIDLYPMMDGAYIVTNSRTRLLAFFEDLLQKLSLLFVNEKESEHRFIPKAAVAFGPVIHGKAIPKEASYTLENNAPYKNQLLLGMPMVQAIQSEAKAPPFGIYIHESARAIAPPSEYPFVSVWYHWFLPNHKPLAKQLSQELGKYYDWCEKRTGLIEYPGDRIKEHRELARQYLIDV